MIQVSKHINNKLPFILMECIFHLQIQKIEPNAVDILEMVNKHLSSVIPRKNFGTT